MRERWLALALLAASAIVLWPFAPWILLAIWTAVLLRPVCARLDPHRRLAAVLATIALALLAVPVIIVVASLADDAIALVRRVLASEHVQNWLQAFAREPVGHGGRAWSMAQQVAGTAARAAIGLVILFGGVYSLLVDGGRLYAWLEAHAPISRESFRRYAGAIVETGRGLLFGIVGAGLAQALVATIMYVALGVPEPFALGLLTLACSIIPAIGTSLVWLPVSIALAVSGRDVAAVIMLLAGLLVIGTIDNFVRPYLARRGRLSLPTLVVAIGMFGGVAVMGARGIIFGPLILRLAKEALTSAAETREAASP
jgi:predicted PurR-regulated permease PerM